MQRSIFPEYLIDYIITSNYKIIDVKIEREKIIDNNKAKRSFMRPNEILVISDNVKFVVCNQWSKDNIDRFIKVASDKGVEITRVRMQVLI